MARARDGLSKHTHDPNMALGELEKIERFPSYEDLKSVLENTLVLSKERENFIGS